MFRRPQRLRLHHGAASVLAYNTLCKVTLRHQYSVRNEGEYARLARASLASDGADGKLVRQGICGLNVACLLRQLGFP